MVIISKGTRSVLVNLCNFSSQFQYYAFHSISHKWTKLRTKTPKNLYFMFLLYPIGLQTHYRRTFFSWNKPNLYYAREKNCRKGLPVTKNLPSRNVGCHGFTLVMQSKVWCWHLLFVDDFSETAEKSLNCNLEKKHVPVSKSTGYTQIQQ